MELEGKLPEGKYDLIVPTGSSLRVRAADSEKARAAIRQWVVETAPTLAAYSDDDRNEQRWSVTATPPGISFPVTLQRWSHPGQSRILIKRFRPEALETSEVERADDAGRSDVAASGLRSQRIDTALKKKLGKLANAKREFEATESILVLESDDVALANGSVIGDAIRESLKDHEELPDTIYLPRRNRPRTLMAASGDEDRQSSIS